MRTHGPRDTAPARSNTPAPSSHPASAASTARFGSHVERSRPLDAHQRDGSDEAVDRDRVERALHLASRSRLSLVWTQNTRAMLSVRTVSGVRHVRLHAMFATAPAAVLRAVSRFIRGDDSARGAIDRFVAAHTAPADVRPRPPRARGLVHDLDEILDEVSRRYFDGAVRVPIGWSRQGHARHTRGRRTIRLGVYLVHAQQIRVHPALDQRWVPRSLLAWVVFHELLHHVVPIGRSRGKRSIHSEEFRALEASFDGHAQALRWVRENLPRLLASRGVARSTRDACRSRSGAVDVPPRR